MTSITPRELLIIRLCKHLNDDRVSELQQIEYVKQLKKDYNKLILKQHLQKTSEQMISFFYDSEKKRLHVIGIPFKDQPQPESKGE